LLARRAAASVAAIVSHLTLLALGLLAAGGAGAAGFLLWRRLRLRQRLLRRVLRRGPRLRHPVVLVHGLLGFDTVQLAGFRHEYFRGLPALLEAQGCCVHRARVAPAGSVAERAEALAACVRALPDRRVNILAHSMGGLDARYAIAKLGLADRVASLTTVATPHRGTPLADLGSGLVGGRLGRALVQLGVPLGGLNDLTTARSADFNATVQDVPGVAYGSVVGVSRARRRTHPLLLPGWLYLRSAAGDNDGVVPSASQPWGELLAEIEADHWAQIGWSRHFDAPAFYQKLLRELRGRGF
jgi:triacylglycerol lipase